ncbi:MAG: FAD-dependent oxidoreductase [bacterium]|nr:FAD-dependent oxidoreductase [bacterium]
MRESLNHLPLFGETKPTISRGRFLSLAALSALALQRPLRAAKAEKILVIGAGMAGLAAAWTLKAAGHTVTVIEGRTRIGGRIHTSQALGAPLDLGAAWIHGSKNALHPMVHLAAQTGSRMVETDFESMRLYTQRSNPGEANEIAWDPLEDAYEEVLADLFKERDRLQEKRKDRSVGKYLRRLIANTDLDPGNQRALHWWFNTEYGVELAANLDDLSLRSLDEDLAFGGDESILPQGYSALIQYLAKRVEIQTGRTVRSIALKKNQVHVMTDRGEFTADRAIVTLPLGVLKSGRVKFSPNLSDRKQQAIQKLGFGALEKVALRFPKRFWPNDIFQFGYVPAAGQSTLVREIYNYQPYTRQPILVGLAGGDQARQLQKNKRAAVADMLAVLREIFGNSIPQPKGSLVTNWVSDPFAQGAYSHVPVGAGLGYSRILAEAIDDRILFAGEHTNAWYPGTTHGAYLSGLAAAESI